MYINIKQNVPVTSQTNPCKLAESYGPSNKFTYSSSLKPRSMKQTKKEQYF